ncbi:tyrosine-type recombinase/integrase [Acidithiobacillus sulfurivorans]|uniref:tyrosine-type recombinase/integrase n=1 Tax=Acidithiobacillus sulfurivorans TaxID=1958756 RepID=UPI0034A26E40
MPGLGIRLGIPILRHEATSRLFEKGLSPVQAAAITGHKNMQMLKRYTHLRPEDLAKLLG